MLTVNGIRAVYNGVVLALSDVSLQVKDGSSVVLLGGNGSGKSTTLKSISGILRAEEGELTEGTIELDSQRIDRANPEALARLGICHVLQGRWGRTSERIKTILRETWPAFTIIFPGWWHAAIKRAGTFPAASSRCW